MGMKQDFFSFFWKKKIIQNGQLKKPRVFQNRQFSKFVCENFMDWYLGLVGLYFRCQIGWVQKSPTMYRHNMGMVSINLPRFPQKTVGPSVIKPDWPLSNSLISWPVCKTIVVWSDLDKIKKAWPNPSSTWQSFPINKVVEGSSKYNIHSRSWLKTAALNWFLHGLVIKKFNFRGLLADQQKT